MARLVKVLIAGIRTADAPVASGLAYAYDTGTTTPGTYLYTEPTLTTAHSNPATLDAEGRLEAYCSDTANFRIVVKNAAATTTYVDVDPAESSNAALTSSITVDTTNDDALTAGAGSLLSAWMDFIWLGLSGRSTATTAKDLKYLHTGTGAVGRYWRARFSEVFSVMDFGAVGDGTQAGGTDDTVAIQAAIDAASTAGGGGVYFPANSYRCTGTLTIGNDSGVSLFGDGPGSIIIQNFSNAPLITISGTTTACEIASLQLQGGGSTLTTAALGISVASGIPAAGSVPVNIHDVVFGGSADGTGFNVAIEALGTRGLVNNCFFHRLYGANSRAVRTNTGGQQWHVSNCHILGQDGAGTRLVSGIGPSATGATAGYQLRVTGCYISGTSGAGIRLIRGGAASITGCTFSACQGAGVQATSAIGWTVTGCVFEDGQDGVLIDEDGATSGTTPSEWAVTGNTMVNLTRNGVRAINATDSADYTPRNGVISGNAMRRCGQSAIALLGADDVLVSGNTLASCSTDATYPAIDVQSSLPVATHRGGSNNSIVGNHIMDLAGATWSTPVRIQGSGGGIITNVSTTLLANNRLQCSGTLAYTYGVTTQSPIMHGNLIGSSYGATVPWVEYTAAATTLTAQFSGGIVTNTGAAANMVLTLPDLSGTTAMQGLVFTIIRIAAFNIAITAAASDSIVRSTASTVTTGTITLTASTDQVVTIYSKGIVWYASALDSV